MGAGGGRGLAPQARPPLPNGAPGATGLIGLGSGGGILNLGALTVVNCTVAYNNVASGGTGGGLDGLAGTVTLDNTIVAAQAIIRRETLLRACRTALKYQSARPGSSANHTSTCLSPE